MQNEKEYIIFILGYDLLNEELSNNSDPECDIAYDKCNKIADDFINSEYNNEFKGMYDCLVDYVESERYLKFIYPDKYENTEEDEI